VPVLARSCGAFDFCTARMSNRGPGVDSAGIQSGGTAPASLSALEHDFIRGSAYGCNSFLLDGLNASAF
jgi:hypothetical protein